MPTHSPLDAGFAARVGHYCAAAAQAAARWYDVDGRWVGDTKPAETRERFWLAGALYAAGAVSLADAVIRPGETADYHGVRFNIFDSNIAAALLVGAREVMAPDVRAKLKRLVRDSFSFKPGNRQPDYQFHGYNDNMPAKGTMGLVLGGELLGDAGAVAYGVWSLRQLRAMLVRDGINSEYNSPTYSPLTIHAMGEIAAHAQDAEARALARGIEERLWIDLAARFHPGLGVVAGPYARAYTIDTLAHVSCVAALLWFTLGEGVNPSPMELFAPPDGLVVHHKGDYPFNIAQMCWFATGTYHIPDQARELFAGKRYPFRAVATAELGDAGPDFPARPCRLESVHHADFSLGTVNTPFLGGEQTMSYFVTYKRREPVASFRDVGTVFTKLVVDDEMPGTIEQGEEIPAAGAEWHTGERPVLRYANAGEADHVHAYANTVTLQADATALVATHPHLALGGNPDTGAGGRTLSRLSELVIFPSHFGGADELLVGGEARECWTGDVPPGAWIACRRGRLLMAIRPLAYSRLFGHASIALERVENYELIRATLFQGEPRTFTRPELRFMCGGFIAEHASVDDYPSLAAFVAELSAAQFTDYYWTTRRLRYRRPAGARPALEFELSWSQGSHEPRIAAINGRAVAHPPVQIDGVDPATLPFLHEPFHSVPSFFPWEDFSVEWGDWPYAIGDREA
jgi:hypothetical protein